MILFIAIILLLIIAISPFVIMYFLVKDTDWDQEEERLLCDSYKEISTTQSNQVASNPGII